MISQENFILIWDLKNLWAKWIGKMGHKCHTEENRSIEMKRLGMQRNGKATLLVVTPPLAPHS